MLHLLKKSKMQTSLNIKSPAAGVAVVLPPGLFYILLLLLWLIFNTLLVIPLYFERILCAVLTISTSCEFHPCSGQKNSRDTLLKIFSLFLHQNKQKERKGKAV